MVPGSYILLAFKDSGCGMNDETLRHIFEPFFTTKAVGHGTGLGLATVYGIVKQLDGYVEVTSHPGEGTSFLIYLPSVVGEAVATGEVATVAPDRSRHQVRATILLVEDNQMVREMAQDLLELHGFTVLSADSPATALEIEQIHSGTIELMITDVVMPEMNGMELYEVMQERRPRLPVIYMSGYTNDLVIHDGTLEEQVNFLKKPFSAEQLVERVWKTLGAE